MKIKSLILLTTFSLFLTACGAETPVAAIPVERSISVSIVNTERKEIKNELAYPGYVKATEQIAVIGKLQGKVDQVFAKVGDSVNEGDVLFTMDATDIESNIKSLEAQLAAADATIRAAETGVALVDGSAMQSQILQASGGVEQAQTALKQAEQNIEQSSLTVEQHKIALDQAQTAYNDASKNLSDNKTLYDNGIITRTAYEQTETSLKNAQFALDQAKSALQQAENNLGTIEISKEQAEKSYEQAVESQRIITGQTISENLRKANDVLQQSIAQRNSIQVSLDSARERLSDISVTAPISGVISSRSIEPKTMLSAATVPFTLISSDTVEISVNVTESMINKLSIGQNVPVLISAATDTEFTAEIITLAPAANDITAAFEVRLLIENSKNLIKPGMYAEIRFTKEASRSSIVVPRSAVMEENEQQFVYIAENNAAKKTFVTTGIDNGAEIELTSGVNPDEAIIVKGQNYLHEGAKILIDESTVKKITDEGSEEAVK